MAGEPSRAVKLCGTEEVDQPFRRLAAGALSVELENGALRYVRLGEHEVIRAIAFLVRDENWGTFTPSIANLRIEETADAFAVTYDATCADASRQLDYSAVIRGRSDGSLRFEVSAQPRTDVLTNRTGFIVLHPLKGVAGANLRVLHADGGEVTMRLPEEIDPVQPLKNIRALTHEVTPGVSVTCRMEGDVFEMEDQRNWSDASFKTYVRPLARPWPYRLPAGETFAQSVTIDCSGPLPPSPRGQSGAATIVTITNGAPAGTVPLLGLGLPAEEATHAAASADLLRRLAPRHLLATFDARRHGAAELAAHRRVAELTGAAVALEIVIPGGPDPAAELMPIAAAVADAGLAPASVAVFPQQDLRSVLPGTPWPAMPSAAAIAEAARAAFPGLPLGGGMFSYFTELNRKRPPAGLHDYITHATCPIVHAADDRSVMETLECLPYIVRSTRAFIGATPYHIGPSQIGCRDNPYGAATSPNPDDRRVCLARNDPRQRGLFNAAWTLGYVAALAHSGVEALTMAAPTGPFGVIHRRTDLPQPWFDELDGPVVYPAFHVLAGLFAASGLPLLATQVSGPGIAALAVREGGRTVLWLANLRDESCEVELEGANSARATVLDAAAFAAAATDPDFMAHEDVARSTLRLTLDAYAVARIVMA
jgi:D-apionolactonase